MLIMPGLRDVCEGAMRLPEIMEDSEEKHAWVERFDEWRAKYLERMRHLVLTEEEVEPTLLRVRRNGSQTQEIPGDRLQWMQWVQAELDRTVPPITEDLSEGIERMRISMKYAEQLSGI